MAASSRKKQDEKHLKILRELAVQNKYCFDCNQRGPTYVNVTVGSFVCTKCSGMLRGITPPHRVKSISMATFTPDEIEVLRTRGGNDYCRRVWLGLHDGAQLVNASDEHAIRDLMVDKYEKRRFYLEPEATPALVGNGTTTKPERPKPPTLINEQKPVARVNGTNKEHHRTRPEVQHTIANNTKNMDFVADFDRADIFTAHNNLINQQQQQQQHMSNGFADFDNNPVFTTTNVNNGNGRNNGHNSAFDSFSIFDLQFTHNDGPVLNRVPLFPKCNANLNSEDFSLLTPATNFINGQQQQQQTNGWPKTNVVEDKYAALKDLDNALKTQSAVDWGSTGSSNGSLYSSPTPTGSMYSSSSPQSSLFGSPSQSNFMSAFAPQEPPTVSNPFNNNGWPLNNGNPNPFKDSTVGGKNNGFNPFKMGAAPIISNNPFL